MKGVNLMRIYVKLINHQLVTALYLDKQQYAVPGGNK